MIRDLIKDGIQKQIDKANEGESKKLGNLRAGNTGMLDESGRIIGSCAAAAYLRMKGINLSTVDVNKELMFAGGRLNEDHWVSALKESWQGEIRCEEEVATCWETEQGIKVTGRPDVVLFDNEQPAVGIELKQVMSVNASYNVLIKQEPQLKHLMQAAHYMWQLETPFELWYTNRNNLDLPDWLKYREFPKPNEMEEIQYRYYRFGDINPKTGKPIKHQITAAEFEANPAGCFAEGSKITPFLRGFRLMLDNGRLYYTRAENDRDNWVETIVKIEDIERFYNYVGEMDSYGKVPPEVLNLKPDGSKYGWTYKQYSDLGKLDAGYNAGKSLKSWVDKVKKHLDENKR